MEGQGGAGEPEPAREGRARPWASGLAVSKGRGPAPGRRCGRPWLPWQRSGEEPPCTPRAGCGGQGPLRERGPFSGPFLGVLFAQGSKVLSSWARQTQCLLGSPVCGNVRERVFAHLLGELPLKRDMLLSWGTLRRDRWSHVSGA